MSEYVPEGALLPSGINVDETAAYFGITDSSQILLDLENSNRHTAITIVLNKISDLLLTDTFDLDSGSNRLQVESGEIYYILTGPLELLKITENLQNYLGLNPEENSIQPNITEEQFLSLKSLLDPMTILKIYAIGDVTGGNNELAKYVTAFDEMINNPSENVENLSQISKELTEILIDTKNMQMPRSISILKSSKAVPAPKLMTPQKPIQEEVVPEENKVEAPKEKVETNVSPTTNLQEPTSLKPPPNKTNIVEPTPLIKAEKIQRPVFVPKEEPKTTMEELEKNSLNTNNWVEEKNTTSSVENFIAEPNTTPRLVPVVPKTKPITPEIIPAPKVQPTNEPIVPKTTPSERIINTQNHIYQNSTPELPKPKQNSLPKPVIRSNTNGIIRTFPNGNLCNSCGVSLSNSWRFCPLCGFNC